MIGHFIKLAAPGLAWHFRQQVLAIVLVVFVFILLNGLISVFTGL